MRLAIHAFSRLALLAASAVLLLGEAAPVRADDSGRGPELFQLCAQCHGPAGGGNPASLAPAIAGMPVWYIEAQLHKFREGVRGLHPQDVGGLRMYPMSLSLDSEEDLSAVASYVASLPRVPQTATVSGGDPSKGAASYAICAACHGADGAGNQAMTAPALSGSSDWYLVTSIQKFKSGVRGSDPRDQLGAAMRGMVMTLADEQAVKDVVAHIMTLPAK